MRKKTMTIALAMLITSLTGISSFNLVAEGREMQENQSKPWESNMQNMKLKLSEDLQSKNPLKDPFMERAQKILEDQKDLIQSGSEGSVHEATIMGWIYPGEPACDAKEEYQTRKLDILKPEYFTVSDNGRLVLLTPETHGCNAYSKANIADIKKYSQEQYVTVSSANPAAMNSFLIRALKDKADIKKLVTFAVDNGITGIELDFEGFGSWDKKTYANYKSFVKELGNALHAQDKKLMIDGPAVSNKFEEDTWYIWRYKDFVSLPVDTIVVMAYDYQYDYGSGASIAPLHWTKEVIDWTVSKFPDTSRLAIGIPSYGYQGVQGSYDLTLLTYEQIKNKPGFKTAVRDGLSQEMTWKNGKTVYFYQDSVSMQKKLEVIKDAGIDTVSVWHLGGNSWF